jgi:transmembrane sensor
MGQEQKEIIWNLIAKKLSGEASPEEFRELEGLLRDNPELHYPIQTIIDLWEGPERISKKEAELAFSRHLNRMEYLQVEYGPSMASVSQEVYPDPDGYPWPQKRRASRRKILIGTSIFGLLLTTVGWLYHKIPQTPLVTLSVVARIPTVAGNEIFTGSGSRTHLTLPDGTLVWLNAGSRLTYGKNYGVAGREVSLTGEAFFDVAKNVERPFLIHTTRIDIRVLGTSFNVKSYPTDKTTEATLLHGSIEVSINDRPNEKIILKPDEKLVVANDDSTLHRSGPPKSAPAGTDESLVTIRKPTYEHTTGAVIETSWVNDKLTFQEEAFDELSRQMERWYGVTIRFEDPGLEQLQFTGSFKGETIQQALDALSLTARFTYIIEGNQVVINK